MNKLIQTVLIVFGLLLGTNAHADCYYNGTPYGTGTKVGSLVCMPSGRWKRP